MLFWLTTNSKVVKKVPICVGKNISYVVVNHSEGVLEVRPGNGMKAMKGLNDGETWRNLAVI